MMRLRSDSDELTPVHWFFTEENAEHFGSPHLFGTSDWNKQGRTAGQIGEQPAPKTFTLGTNKGLTLGHSFCGSREDYAKGATAASPLHFVDALGRSDCCGDHGEAKVTTWATGNRWAAGMRTTAHYTTSWRTEDRSTGTPAFRPRYETTWRTEDHWEALQRTSGVYATEWRTEDDWAAIEKTLAHYATEWRTEDHWEAGERASAHYATEWRSEDDWAAVEKSRGVYATAWRTEDDWTAIQKTLGVYSTSWRTEDDWAAVEKTRESRATTWKTEDNWSAVEKASAHYATTWQTEDNWSAVKHTVDNVTTFDCGTIVAAGTTQGTATTIANDTVSATSTGIGQGCILPAGCYRVTFRNNNAAGGNAIFLYPPSGAKLGNNTTNTAITVNAQQSITAHEVTGTQWVYFTAT